ncbi:APC family permease [Nocardiopsis coralliicola]
MSGAAPRTVGTADAAVLGAAAMVGAGVFAVFAPAAGEAGAWLPVALVLAGIVAFCNATSAMRLAVAHPRSGGAYVWGRARLGDLWGYLAGWSFTVGKTASCAVMALAFASYALPGWERPAAAAAVLVLTVLNLFGLRSTARTARILLAAVALVLAGAVAAAASSGRADSANLALDGAWPGSFGLLGAAGMLFFAFAGYARIATLAGEVRDPARTLPRATMIALGAVLATYLAVALAVLAVLGPQRLAASQAPLADAMRAAGAPELVPVVAAGAALAGLGALLALLPAVARTAAAMADDGHLPGVLARRSAQRGTPWVADTAVGAAVILLVLVFDLGSAVAFSAFGVLVYYVITNASALRLGPDENRPPLFVALGGLTGCVVLAMSLPLTAVAAGVVVIALGGAAYAVTHRPGTAPPPPADDRAA